MAFHSLDTSSLSKQISPKTKSKEKSRQTTRWIKKTKINPSSQAKPRFTPMNKVFLSATNTLGHSSISRLLKCGISNLGISYGGHGRKHTGCSILLGNLSRAKEDPSLTTVRQKGQRGGANRNA